MKRAYENQQKMDTLAKKLIAVIIHVYDTCHNDNIMNI